MGWVLNEPRHAIGRNAITRSGGPERRTARRQHERGSLSGCSGSCIAVLARGTWRFPKPKGRVSLHSTLLHFRRLDGEGEQGFEECPEFAVDGGEAERQGIGFAAFHGKSNACGPRATHRQASPARPGRPSCVRTATDRRPVRESGCDGRPVCVQRRGRRRLRRASHTVQWASHPSPTGFDARTLEPTSAREGRVPPWPAFLRSIPRGSGNHRTGPNRLAPLPRRARRWRCVDRPPETCRRPRKPAEKRSCLPVRCTETGDPGPLLHSDRRLDRAGQRHLGVGGLLALGMRTLLGSSAIGHPWLR